ncbi:hypothetical protein BX600DRAFT_433101 [Xylariales sp. PMI_506]|nr:hypothetical protein BX600DRAFT_433101 [Xylariales sp. PMI_506]
MSSSAELSFGSHNPFRRPSSSTTPTASTTAPTSSTAGARTDASSLFGEPIAANVPRPPLTTFKAALESEADVEQAPPRDDRPVQLQPKKIVKKVRVQSPPPSSPEDTAPVRGRIPDDYSEDDSSSESADNDDNDNDNDHDNDIDQDDPFDHGVPERHEPASDERPLPRPPPNPFAKTLQDLEQSSPGQDIPSPVGSGNKGTLDVNSFKRLLLTGYANLPGSPPGGQRADTAGASPSAALPLDGASNTDASSVSRQSIFDAMQETPRTSHEISEAEEPEERRSILPSSPLSTVQSASARKKPPPPSSRHGKLIKIELATDSKPISRLKASTPPMSIDTDASTPTRRPGSASASSPPADVNKPLPLPPSLTPAEEEVESPFDRNAAGKLPEAAEFVTAEPLPATPPLVIGRARSESQTSTLTTSSAHRKPAAPPPRRHGRTDSRAPASLASPGEEDPPRSSFESTRSRADSLRVNISSEKNILAPAPPPPRRPNHARQGSSFTSPTASSFTSVSSDDIKLPPANLGFSPLDQATVVISKDTITKISPPPPPPARHSSMRRPPSVHGSLDPLKSGNPPSRKVSKDKEGAAGGIAPPPPPPPSRRARGGSKGSMNAGNAAETLSLRSIDDGPVSSVSESGGTNTPGAGDDIMKQLQALQKEVEAARMASGTGAE